MRPVSLALIGGGAAATLFLAHLMRRTDLPPLDVTVFDRTGHFGTGIAYGTTNPHHLLNVRADGMSGFHDDPKHFTHWLAQRHPDCTGHDFAPRMVYGAYLRDILAGAQEDAVRNGHRITLETAEITGVENGGTLVGAGRTWRADHIVLATGNANAMTPPGARDLTPANGYHNDPWRTSYEHFAAADHIVVLGTGLSMIDTVIALDDAGFRGRVTAISRNGLMPAVHTDSAAILSVTEPAPEATAHAYVRFVRRHARAAEAQGLSWQAAIGGLRPVTNEWWLRLPEGERRKLRRALPFWNVHRHRTAPAPGAVVCEWLDQGRLSIAKGRITNLRRDPQGGVAVAYGGRVVTAPHVINCLGYGCTPAQALPGGAALAGIGPVLCDRLIETTAIPEIRHEAAALARDMAL